MNSQGSQLLFSTFLGGGLGGDLGYDVTLNDAGDIYITGTTSSSDFPVTVNAYDNQLDGGSDAFITIMSSDGINLIYSTFIGGGGTETGWAIDVDALHNIFITGATLNDTQPLETTANAYNTTHSGDQDAFVTVLNADGSSLIYSSFFGGKGADFAEDMAITDVGEVYITGITAQGTVNFPTTVNAFNTSNNGGNDAFISKIVVAIQPNAPANISLHTTDLMTKPSVTLLWEEPFDGNDKISKYNIYRGIVSGTHSLINNTAQTHYIDDSILLNTTYFYTITSENSIGQSISSQEYEITVFTNQPQNTTVVSSVTTSITSTETLSVPPSYSILRQIQLLKLQQKFRQLMKLHKFQIKTVAHQRIHWYSSHSQLL